MIRRGTSLASHVPVTVAALLIATSLTGARLYASSTGSAALEQQRSETCATASALTLPIPQGRADAPGTVRAIGETVPLMAAPIHGARSAPIMDIGSTVDVRIALISLDGAGEHVDPPLKPLGPYEIAVSRGTLTQLAMNVGDTLRLKGPVHSLTIAQAFDDVPFTPIPDYWCGYPQFFEPTEIGDLPPPWAIGSLETVTAYPDRQTVFDTYRVAPEPITLTQGHEVERGYARAVAEWRRIFESTGLDVPRNEWTRVLQRASAVHVTVERNLAPVLLIALVADLIVLVAAAVLVARERRRELRLLAVRGVHPTRVALHVAPPLAVAVAVGSVLGYAIAWVGVSTLGPSTLLEPTAMLAAGIAVGVAALLAVVVVAAVVATVADRYADPRPVRVGTRIPAALVVVALVALAVVSFRRLDERGGVRTSGVLSSGGDLLAMGFPLFTLLAVIAVIGFGVALITPRLRLSGSRWRRAVRLGWRRVVLEAAPLAAIVMSVALAAGCFTIAFALSRGAEQQLHDKAEVYVGADLSVVLYGEPSVPAEWQSTFMSRVRAKTSGPGIDVLGIDPDTFVRVARMRDDGADRSLGELVATLAGAPRGDGLAAIEVGGDAGVGGVVDADMPGNPEPVPLRVVATARFFPTKASGAPLYVVLADEMDAVVPFPIRMVLVRDPPSDALAQLRDRGARMGLVRDASRAFDGSAYSALRWAYVPLAALGMLFVAVALALQLLVVSARREQRRIAHALMVRTGFDRRAAWVAALVEIGVPLAVGTVVGIIGAVGASSAAIRRLDPMPTLDPPAAFLLPVVTIVGSMLVVPVWTAVIGWFVVRSTERADPMQVFQGAA